MFDKIKSKLAANKQKDKEYWENLDYELESKKLDIQLKREVLHQKQYKFLIYFFYWFLIVMLSITLITSLSIYLLGGVDEYIKLTDRSKSLYTEDVNVSTVSYDDVASDSSALVNFNQLFSLTIGSFSSVSSLSNECTLVISGDNSTAGNLVFTTGIEFDSSHYYYFKMPEFIHLLSSTGSGIVNRGGEFVGSGYSGTATRIYYHSSYGTWTTGTYYFMCIDLTQMFGSGNEPTLTQCRDLFIADYYNYNTGSSVSLNGLESYRQGFNDATGGFTWVPTNSYFVNSIQGVSLGDYQGTINASSDSVGVNSVSTSTYTTCYIPFNFIVPLGSYVNFTGRMYLSGGDHATRYLHLAYYSNGSMVEIVKHSISGGTWYPMNFNFTAPTDMSGCYLYLSDQELGFSLNVAEFSILTTDPYAAVQTSYDSGWENAKKYYDNYYSENGEGYQEIFQLGKTAGINEDSPFTFEALMTSVIEAPLNAVLQVFNFEFLGYNLKSFVLLILTMCVVIAVVRLFMGG